MDKGTIGPKYDSELSTAAIAARFRADLKAAVVAGELPAMIASVRTKRFAGGSSITVLIRRISGFDTVTNPEGIRPRIRADVQEIRDKVLALLNAYNFDHSDVMSDYYHVRFFAHVDIET